MVNLRIRLLPLFLLYCLLTTHLFAQNWGNPVWADEFNGAENSAPDSTKWTFDTANLGVNNELEIYCSNPVGSSPSPCDSTNPNAYVDGNGNLVIKALKTASGTWTSARLKTQGISTAEFQYGRIEARIKLPSATGLWPAFWMLGNDIGSVGWPQSGEIDIMENVLTAPLGAGAISSTIHGPGYSGGNGISKVYTFPNHGRVDDGYHIYGAIWSPSLIQFYVDDPSHIFQTIPATAIPAATNWVYNHPFFLILNLAVGGDWPGPPDTTTPNPSLMLVDYVRVYKAATVPGPKMTAPGISITAGQTGTGNLSLTSTAGTGKVYLACSNAPTNSTCGISPSFVDFTSSANATATITLVTQTHTSGANRDNSRTLAFLTVTISMIGVLFFPTIRKGHAPILVGIIVLSLPILAINGCSGGSGNSSNPSPATGGTPSGSYMMTVTAYTVSGDQSTTTVAVTVK